ncbi:MAG: hypothetical protein QXF24_00205 [Thermoproteota archaeon]
MAEQRVEFDIGPWRDWRSFTFSVGAPGTLELEVRWQGTADAMRAELSNVEVARREKKAALTLRGPSPLRGKVEVGAGEVGRWRVALEVMKGGARGTLVLAYDRAAASPLEAEKAELPRMSPEAANFVSLYAYHVERALEGIRETEVDRAIGGALARATRDARDSYELFLKRYKAVPFEEKVRLGFDPQVLRQLEDFSKPLAKSALKDLARGTLRPRTRPNPVPRARDGDDPGDPASDAWSMNLAWTELVCHRETTGFLRLGSDEPVAIFLMLEGVVTSRIDVAQLSDACKAELFLAAIAGRLSDALEGDPSVISPGCRNELLEKIKANTDFSITDRWIRRTQKFEDVDSGERRAGYVLLSPKEEGRGWQVLREYAVSSEGGIVSFSMPAHVVVSLIFELDDGVDGIMDALESHLGSLGEVADELVDAALEDVAIGAAIGSIAGIIGAGIGALIAWAVQPEFVGHGEMVFTCRGYGKGADPSDFANLQPLAPGTSHPSLRDRLFTGDGSDYELGFRLALRSSALSCVGFDPSALEVVRKGFFFRYWVIEERSGKRIARFDREREARLALSIIRHYGMTQHCQLGAPAPSMEYWLVNGRPPAGAMPGEDCVGFDPQNLEVKKVDGRWTIVEGTHWLLSFGEREEEARTALSIIKQYGFNRVCFVGRPKPSMTYFRV